MSPRKMSTVSFISWRKLQKILPYIILIWCIKLYMTQRKLDKMAERIKFLKQKCFMNRKLVINRNELYEPEAFIIDQKDKLTFCPLGKVSLL